MTQTESEFNYFDLLRYPDQPTELEQLLACQNAVWRQWYNPQPLPCPLPGPQEP